jgi:vacuolar iron transporter family protein
MSLVSIKNFFFGTSVPTSSPQREPLLGRRRAGSPDTLVECDVESQTTRRDSEITVDGSKRFRVDARVISDATIGLSDGLTVPFALTAGLSALGQTKVVVFGGLAELIAGAISMGLGGYLGAKSEAYVFLLLLQIIANSKSARVS